MLVNDCNVDSGREAYLTFNLKFDDIEGCLDSLYREDTSYVIDNPELDVENLLEQEIKDRNPESYFALKLFAVKFNIDIPVINIERKDESYDPTTLFVYHYIKFKKDEKDPELVFRKPYLSKEILTGNKFFIVLMNNLLPTEDGKHVCADIRLSLIHI